MNYADLSTSPRRNKPFLLPEEAAALMPTEAELLAIDHATNAAKRMGVSFSGFAMNEQANRADPLFPGGAA